MRRIFVIGDIHGAYRALRQCFERAQFNYEEDHLICLGDVVDGWPETRSAIEEVLHVRHLTYILGNHDWWALRWMRSGEVGPLWYGQGGKATVGSYADGIPAAHISLLSEARLYYLYENKLFVHAGIDPLTPLSEQDENTFLWDRTLASRALNLHPHSSQEKLSSFDEIYIGHTPIANAAPLHAAGVWLMDTGAGWSGVLSMMDISTKETFISDPVPSLYPGIAGRARRE